MIEDGVTSIGDYSFSYCAALTNVDIHDGVTSIGGLAFYNCTALTDINIPNGVTSISQAAFQNCTSLTSVTIGNSVTSIGQYTFTGCTGLTSIICEPTTPPTLSNANTFNNTNNCPIYVPAASVDTYKTANIWSTYASRIQAIQS